MCGIIGIVSDSRVANRDWLRQGSNLMNHRGPDASGEWWSDEGNIGFFSKRLSIIDLSSAGVQPMHSIDKKISIVFNGEIYNYLELRKELLSKGYKFLTDTDTEVIIFSYIEWGNNCVNRLDGMFAFSIYDKRQGKLFAARDRAGEKPLYYKRSYKKLAFSSELKGLLQDPECKRKIDYSSLDSFLFNGFVPSESSIIDGIQKLQPAHAFEFFVESDRFNLWRYWDLPVHNETNFENIRDEALVDEFEDLLGKSISKQLQSDAPIGLLLSGGVDSSLVTAMASKINSSINTFTISFPNEKKYDEKSHARLIADYFGTNHIEIESTDLDFNTFYEISKKIDEPMADSSLIPTYTLTHLVKDHCKVVLGGDGGDELFGGYGHYKEMLSMQKRLKGLPTRLKNIASCSAKSLLPIGFKGRSFLSKFNSDLENQLHHPANFFDLKHRKRLLKDQDQIIFDAEALFDKNTPIQEDLIRRSTEMDFRNALPEDMLVKIDRSSMLNSLEMRAPFLDYKIIEFAFNRVPSRLKITNEDQKILPKMLCKKILPSQFDLKRKQGLSIPLHEWLKEKKVKNFFSEILLDEKCIFDSNTVTALLNNHYHGIASNSSRLFALAQFELWRNEYKVSL